jgi:hypothetical protein
MWRGQGLTRHEVVAGKLSRPSTRGDACGSASPLPWNGVGAGAGAACWTPALQLPHPPSSVVSVWHVLRIIRYWMAPGLTQIESVAVARGR